MNKHTFVPKQLVVMDKIKTICSEANLETLSKGESFAAILKLVVRKSTGLVDSFERIYLTQEQANSFVLRDFLGQNVQDIDDEFYSVNGSVVVHDHGSIDSLMEMYFHRSPSQPTKEEASGSYYENYAIKSDFISFNEEMAGKYPVGTAMATIDIESQEIVKVKIEDFVVVGEVYKSKPGTIKVACMISNGGCYFGGLFM